MTENKQVVKMLDYHRNGVTGLGFFVAIVEETEDGKHREMLVVRFPKEADKETGGVVCAALDLAQLDKREIRFFHNSWRGDYYCGVVDEAIEARDGAPLPDYKTPSPGFNRDPRFLKEAGK